MKNEDDGDGCSIALLVLMGGVLIFLFAIAYVAR